MEKLKEECGIIGLSVPGDIDLVNTAYFGLNALQHRGQVSAGLAVQNDGVISCYKNFGLVSEVFNQNILPLLKGDSCLGHVSNDQHATVFSNNAQPFVVNYSGGTFAVAFNGGMRNRSELKKELESRGSVFSSTSDSEIIAHIIIQSEHVDVVEGVKHVMKKLVGGYALAIITDTRIVAARDPFGIRPLCIGKLKNGYIIASESCAVDLMGGEFVRDVMPGEIVTLENGKLESFPPAVKRQKANCIFEYIYFSRPDSTLDGVIMYRAREKSGQRLAEEHPVEGDIVIGVPDSGTPAAIGYSERSGIPYSAALIKNRYIGRTFVEPSKDKRETALKIKLNPIKEMINGKKLVVVDDSIIRGTTMRNLVTNLRNIGAKEIHLRISSPTVGYPCDFGVFAPAGDNLIAHNTPLEEIARVLGADSVGFLSKEGMIESFKGDDGFCTGCVDVGDPVFDFIENGEE